MVTWAKSYNYWQEPPSRRIFGFNNPSPSVGSPNHGYEFWLTVGPDLQLDNESKIKDFSGGMYGVLHCDVNDDPYKIIPAAWEKLVKWLEPSHYKFGSHQWLEEHLSRSESNAQGFALDLYLPITE